MQIMMKMTALIPHVDDKDFRDAELGLENPGLASLEGIEADHCFASPDESFLLSAKSPRQKALNRIPFPSGSKSDCPTLRRRERGRIPQGCGGSETPVRQGLDARF